jgi:uncharacterized protein YgiM (DUF1202 family)
MKKLFAVCLCLAVASIVSAQVSRGGTLYVAVRSLNLKSSTGFFASNRGTLAYGARVTVLQVNGNWVEVRSDASPSLTGWAAVANLSTKQVVSGNTSAATASEVALAGKGFNQEVENAYRAEGALNYADVDRAETITVNEAELYRFLEEGRLTIGGE